MKKKKDHLKLVKTENRVPFWKKAARFLFYVATLIAVLALLKYGESFFRVNHIEIEGIKKLSAEEIIDAGEISRGMSIILLQESKISEKIEREQPRAKNVRVRRELPDTVSISLEEREPAAYVMTADGFWIIDKHAVPFEYARDADKSYPLVSGIDGSKVIPGLPIDCQLRHEALTEFFAAWPGDIPLEIKEMELQERYNLVVHTVDGLELWLGDGEDMDYKLELIETSLPHIDTEVDARIDVRCGKRLIVSSSAVKDEKKEVGP